MYGATSGTTVQDLHWSCTRIETQLSLTTDGVLKMTSSKLQSNLCLNKGSEEEIYSASQLVITSILFQITVCAFTIGGQNDRPFSGCHESFDGCEEAHIIVEYDINLWEQTVANTSTQAQH